MILTVFERYLGLSRNYKAPRPEQSSAARMSFTDVLAGELRFDSSIQMDISAIVYSFQPHYTTKFVKVRRLFSPMYYSASYSFSIFLFFLLIIFHPRFIHHFGYLLLCLLIKSAKKVTKPVQSAF